MIPLCMVGAGFIFFAGLRLGYAIKVKDSVIILKE